MVSDVGVEEVEGLHHGAQLKGVAVLLVVASVRISDVFPCKIVCI
jgi:hypothetical protein